MLTVFKSFEFVFLLHLMNEIFGYTNDLCNALQKREQDIVNAMDLLEFTKVELDVLRQDSGWQEFLTKVTSFCEKHNVKVVDMNGKYVPMQRSNSSTEVPLIITGFMLICFWVSLIGKFKSLIIGLMR